MAYGYHLVVNHGIWSNVYRKVLLRPWRLARGGGLGRQFAEAVVVVAVVVRQGFAPILLSLVPIGAGFTLPGG